MERMGATEGGRHGEVQPPPAGADGTRETVAKPPAEPALPSQTSQRQTTRGGAGAAAGATPKKMQRPSASSRRRPAGKKPDRHG